MSSSCDNCSTNSDSSGFASGFLMGLVVGGEGGYLLSTEKGQELLASLKENAGDKLTEVMDNPVIADKLADLETTMQEARATIESTTKEAKSRVHTAAQEVAKATKPVKKKKTFLRRGRALS